jgi:hypothetical protein
VIPLLFGRNVLKLFCLCHTLILQEVLNQYYPKALMSELALYTHLSIQDLANAFPNRSFIEIDNLLNLGQVVDCLLTISDARSRYGLPWLITLVLDKKPLCICLHACAVMKACFHLCMVLFRYAAFQSISQQNRSS